MQYLDTQAVRKLSDDDLRNILIARCPVVVKEIVASRSELEAAVLVLMRKAA